MPTCYWIGDNEYNNIEQYNSAISITKSFDVVHDCFMFGLGLDNNDCIWHVATNESIYKFDQTGSVQLSEDVTCVADTGGGLGGGDIPGVAADDTGCIWTVSSGGALSKLKGENAATLSTVETSIAPTDGDEGVTVDGDDILWTAANSLEKVNPSNFTTEVRFNVDPSPAGISQDVDSCLWIVDDFGSEGGLFRYDQLGSVIASFGGLPSNVTGLALSDQPLSSFGGTKRLSLWVVDRGDDQIGKQSRGGTQGTVINTPGGGPWEVVLDEDGSFWHDDVNNNCIYKLDRAGSVIGGQNAPSGAARGLSYDASTGCLWHTDESPANSTVVYQLTGSFNPSLSIVKSFKVGLPDGEGMTNDKQGCLWVGHDDAEKEIQYNQSGSVITSFTSSIFSAVDFPGAQGISEDNSLWLSPSEGDASVYKLNHAGSEVLRYETVTSATGGVATTDQPVFTLGPSVTADKAQAAFGPAAAGTGGTGTVGATKTDIAFYDTVAGLGGIGTDTAVKTPMAFAPIQPTETLVGTTAAIKEAFSHRVKAGQPARLWWDTSSQWESPQKSDNIQVTNGDEVGPVSGSAYIIPTDQNWEGDN